MKISYKNAIKVYTPLFVLGLAILGIANTGGGRALAFQGVLLIVGAALMAVGLTVYMVFWRCPDCRALLPRRSTIPPNCKNCDARLTDQDDEGRSEK